MRITLPTMGGQGLKEKVHNHFGSARYFTIYDTETKGVEVVENAQEHHQHGACQPLQALADLRVDVILTSGMGKRAVMICNQGGMKVYLLSGETVEDAVVLFEKGALRELTPEMGCGGHGGGHDCH